MISRLGLVLAVLVGAVFSDGSPLARSQSRPLSVISARRSVLSSSHPRRGRHMQARRPMALVMDGNEIGSAFGESIVNFLDIYNGVITARILLSWVPPNLLAQAPFLRLPIQVISRLSDVYLNVFRGIIPPFGAIDFSPIIAFFILDFVRNFARSNVLAMELDPGMLTSKMQGGLPWAPGRTSRPVLGLVMPMDRSSQRLRLREDRGKQLFSARRGATRWEVLGAPRAEETANPSNKVR
uniref:YGGT family protein n=1 Tax=Chromera velia CCMP2878 TaxID=1169474 RepID=A0A0G4GP35_9ALVE|mmetsp:Transcript_44059/g.86987  ORF Transcript_44059/g.86987 Transcript_44059/m.86987 type:complete len:239 (+) Transcript_44059:232-948(+)|eukprot:Cvel_22748.t1-p1 / transcript=Cvel_22748.t1 / gene=Cvel_22748 / organism=Chromera_velia_CCMP2878 / gene_product=Uncharacterized protein ycf19, putative / transcript_product=Uncharacterized protein ycf19, putative / location=Cvel_scaffold2270:608-3127(-) / protein_length=238 / sequence_SO=supercontig / SO=protein_coding / is_pseudo=false